MITERHDCDFVRCSLAEPDLHGVRLTEMSRFKTTLTVSMGRFQCNTKLSLPEPLSEVTVRHKAYQKICRSYR